MADERLLWAPHAWLPDGWRERVLLGVGRDGRWTRIEPDQNAPPGTELLPGPLLPSLVNAHSHAFQRAFAGMAERIEGGVGATDDFWSWRDRMYRVALRITPAQLRAIAAQLYVELLRGGFTQVCEFHYLQHQPDGRPYEDRLELGWALAEAAADAGIGLTMLPALYERAGFAQPQLRPDQRRFATDAAAIASAARAYARSGRPRVNAGIAIHSLRAAAPASIDELLRLIDGHDGPVHVHIAEQTGEVDDCLQHTGLRPIEWLTHNQRLDSRWQLVHATHATPQEIDAVAATGAAVVVCPSTEANLGDGLPDLPAWLAAGVPMVIGTDSHVQRDALDELRELEYGQRLVLRRRNVAAQAAHSAGSTAARLFDRAVAGGAAACGERIWGLVPGARADALVADTSIDALLGVPPERRLDALVFTGATRPWREVRVAGQAVLSNHVHTRHAAIAARFEAAMGELWQHDR